MQSIEEIANAIVGDIADVMYQVNNDLEFSLREYENQDAVEMARAFVHVRRVKDELDELSKRFSKVYEELKSVKLPAKFEEGGVPSITLAEGYRVGVSHLVRASIKGEAREQAYEWLREHGLGDLITNTVNASTLSAVAKDMQSDNQDLPEEFFNCHVMATTSVTRTK